MLLLGDVGFPDSSKRCCWDTSPSYQSHWSFLSLSCAFRLMTMFLPKTGICGLTDQDIRSLDSPGSLDSVAPPPVCCTLFSWRPCDPRLPGLIEGKLERVQSPYTSFPPPTPVSRPRVGEVAGWPRC